MSELNLDQISSNSNNSNNEDTWDVNIRPSNLGDFSGQDAIIQKLKIFVQAARQREESLDHTLLCGPPGLGKTTLANILAHEMEVDLVSSSGPTLDKKGDLAAILTGLRPHSVLFIDEIHRLNRVVEEYLYTAMEDFYIDLVTGEGLGARSMKFKLASFTLVGATTRAGLLNGPFRNRFGIVERLSYYSVEQLEKIVKRSSELFGLKINNDAAEAIAIRSRGTPRIANRLLKRIRDFAQVKKLRRIEHDLVLEGMSHLEVDELGLDGMDRQYLELMVDKFEGGPVGIDTLSAALSEEKHTLEEVYEPYLIKEGFVQKTPRGRVATKRAYEHLGRSISIIKSQENIELDL